MPHSGAGLLCVLFTFAACHAHSGVAQLSDIYDPRKDPDLGDGLKDAQPNDDSPGDDADKAPAEGVPAEKEEADENVEQFGQDEMPAPEETGRYVSDRAWDAARLLMESNTTKPERPREIVAVLGSFEFEGPRHSPSQDSELGEAQRGQPRRNLLATGPVGLMPGAARVQIRAAEDLVDNSIHNKKKRELAKKYLMDVQTGRNQLESKTVESLSTKLAAAQKQLGGLMQVEAHAKQMLADPQVGTDLNFDMGDSFGKLKLKVEGWRYQDGHKFYAPQGQHASVEGCKRFMSEQVDKGLVLAAMKKRDTIGKQLTESRNTVKALAIKLRAAEQAATKAKNTAKEKPDELGASKETSEADGKRVLALRQLHEAEVKVKKLENAYDTADEEVAQRQQQALNAVSNYVRDADFRAREDELTHRERKINEREMHLKAATERLEATAKALEEAHDTKLVVEFPKLQEQLRLKERQLAEREEAVRKREKSLSDQARVMKAKIGAFNKGVAETIESSLHSAPRQADKWHHKANLRISSEVDDFQAMLTKVNNKFATGHGARAADRVAKAVGKGTQEINKITKDMDVAAAKAARDGAASAHREPDKVPGGLSSVEGDVDTDSQGTLETGNIQYDDDTAEKPPS